jgi:hypothetical protein
MQQILSYMMFQDCANRYNHSSNNFRRTYLVASTFKNNEEPVQNLVGLMMFTIFEFLR